MLRFQVSTVYAIRALGYMYMQRERRIRVKEMSEALGLDYLYLMKVLNQLKEKKIVCSVRGRHGGHQFGKNTEKISLYNVVMATEHNLNLYPETPNNPHKGIENSIEKYIFDIQSQMADNLQSTSIRTLFEKGGNADDENSSEHQICAACDAIHLHV